RENEVRIRELKSTPGYVVPRCFEPNQKQCQPNKPCKNSRGKGDATSQNFAPALAGMLDKSKNFERNYRENTRHEIQNNATQKTEEQESEDSADGCRTRRGNTRCGGNLPRCAVLCIWVLRINNQARDGRQFFFR